jgi:hypothetical protein
LIGYFTSFATEVLFSTIENLLSTLFFLKNDQIQRFSPVPVFFFERKGGGLQLGGVLGRMGVDLKFLLVLVLKRR